MHSYQLNHVAIHVADVEKSVQFYQQVLLLETMRRPPFKFPGAWFRLGSDQELHLIGEDLAVREDQVLRPVRDVRHG